MLSRTLIILLLFIHLCEVQPSFAGDNALSVEELVKNAEGKVDAASANALVEKVMNNATNPPVINLLKNELQMPAVKNNGNIIANKKGVDVGNLLSRYQPQMKEAIDKPRKLNQLLIFISLSMPENSLTALNLQAKKAGGLLVLRGLVNNSFKETANLLQKASVDVVIDPRLFQAFGVTQVPAFVVMPSDQDPCPSKECNFTPLHDKVSGNVSLDAALENIANGGKVSNEVAKSYLAKLRGKV